MNPVITAIIPTYRRPLLLRRAIASVLSQTYPDVRVCVFDNASGDETAEVVEEIARRDARVVYHRHAENIGAFANFAYGLGSVATPYFSFLSDDDVLLPDFYQRAVDALEANRDAAFWGGTAIVMREDGTVKDATDWPAARYSPPDGLLAMIDNNYLIWTSVLFRTEQVAQIGGLDAEVGAAIDTDYLLRLAARFPYETSPEPAAIWMSHPESSTVLANLAFIWPGWLKVIRNATEPASLPDHARRQVEGRLTDQLRRRLFQTGYNAVRHGKTEEARQVAAILGGTYGQTRRAQLLSVAARTVALCPPARHMVTLAERVRRRGQREVLDRTTRMRDRYGQYARFLALR